MARRLRCKLEDCPLVEVTMRTFEGRMFLRPSPKVNQVIGGVLGVAAEKYPVEVVAVAVPSNHVHLELIPEDALALALFMQFTASNIAREINRLLGRRGHFWERRYVASGIPAVAAEQEARLRYTLSQGAKEGLVARVVQWPGIHPALPLLTGRPIEGVWEDRAKAWQLRQQGKHVSKSDVTRNTELKLAPLPCWRGLSVEERRDRVVAMIESIETEARLEREQSGRKPMGAERVRKQSPFSQPVNPVRPSPAPLFHAHGAVFIMLRQAYQEFVAQFRQAAELLKAGDRNAQFPVGSFPPGLPFVRAKPPPFASTQPA